MVYCSLLFKALAKEFHAAFFQELEERGEIATLRALDTLSTHIQWVLVAGGENMITSAGNRLLNKDRSQVNGHVTMLLHNTMAKINHKYVVFSVASYIGTVRSAGRFFARHC